MGFVTIDVGETIDFGLMIPTGTNKVTGNFYLAATEGTEAFPS